MASFRRRNQVALVNRWGRPTGKRAWKMPAHRRWGRLHLAITAIIVTLDGYVLIQRRSHKKYHAPRLWAPSVCSHPFWWETLIQAGLRRLREELGIVGVTLKRMFAVRYRVRVGRKLSEAEYDHILVGVVANQESVSINHDPDEVEEWMWIKVDDLRRWMTAEPATFGSWFFPIMRECDRRRIWEEVVR